MDTAAQLPVRNVEFGGFPAAPWICVDGHRYGLGDALEGRHGFHSDAVLNERLLRVIVALALARTLRPHNGEDWVTAEELSVSAEAVPTPDATRKFLQRNLSGYTDHPEEEIEFVRVPATHLVQYKPKRKLEDTRLAFGRAKGPYRLGPSCEAIVLQMEGCLSFLGHSRIELLGEAYSLEEAIPESITLEARGEYLSARGLIVRSLISPLLNSTRGLRELAADAYGRLGHLNMQLGLSNEAIWGTRRARMLHEELSNPYGAARALRTEAQAESQLGNYRAALNTAQRARAVFENAAANIRTPTIRSGFSAVIGQRQSHVHNYAAAERNLLNAFRFAEEANDALKVYTWALRRAENFLRQGDLLTSERAFREAHELAARHSIGGVERALLWRATGAFMVATKRWAEAKYWAASALQYALARRLRNEIRHLTPILDAIPDVDPA